ncbi:MAG: hypothetical protein FWD76_00705 [Firmicutes bacterium]|nr:hypothetical protein [Bacillota bacterium]
MKSINSAQGVESVKSTGKQWLARMTKKRWVAVVALSLCFVFCMSFGLQQVLKSKRVESAPTQEVQVSQDFEKLAEKYIDFFVQNDNGTVSLDLSQRVRGGVSIESVDLDTMQAYAQNLEMINDLVAKDVLVEGEDGNYYVKEDGLARNAVEDYFKKGRNDFYVRKKKILFVNVPIGYYLALNNPNALFFALGTQVLANASNEMFASNADFSKWLETVLGTLNHPTIQAILEHFGWDALRTTLQRMYNGDLNAITNIINQTAFGAALKVIIGIISNRINNKVGIPFKQKATENIDNGGKNNTVVMESDLILNGCSIWGANY